MERGKLRIEVPASMQLALRDGALLALPRSTLLARRPDAQLGSDRAISSKRRWRLGSDGTLPSSPGAAQRERGKLTRLWIIVHMMAMVLLFL